MTLGRENVIFGKMVKYHDVMMLCFTLMQKVLYAHDSMMMSVYDITEKHYKRGFLIIVYHREC